LAIAGIFSGSNELPALSGCFARITRYPEVGWRSVPAPRTGSPILLHAGGRRILLLKIFSAPFMVTVPIDDDTEITCLLARL